MLDCRILPKPSKAGRNAADASFGATGWWVPHGVVRLVPLITGIDAQVVILGLATLLKRTGGPLARVNLQFKVSRPGRSKAGCRSCTRMILVASPQHAVILLVLDSQTLHPKL